MESAKECYSESLKKKKSDVYDYFKCERDEKKNVQYSCLIPKDDNFTGGCVDNDKDDANKCNKKFKVC